MNYIYFTMLVGAGLADYKHALLTSDSQLGWGIACDGDLPLYHVDSLPQVFIITFACNDLPEECEKQFHIRKAVPFIGMGILQRKAPNKPSVSLFLPKAQQVSSISFLYGSHEALLALTPLLVEPAMITGAG